MIQPNEKIEVPENWNWETFTHMFIYKNYVGLAIKTGKTPAYYNLHDKKNELGETLKELKSQSEDSYSQLERVSEKYGILFYYTSDFETKPLKKI